MKTILEEISRIAIQFTEKAFTHQQKEMLWLGDDPATIEQIEAVEKRLGLKLPTDYKEFLLITNGFFTPTDSIEPTFESIESINHLKNVDEFLLEIWNEGVLADVGKQMNRAIVVGGLNDEQYFFIIPPDVSNNNWQYWKFANWIPGERRYDNLTSYFSSVLDFIKSQKEKKS